MRKEQLVLSSLKLFMFILIVSLGCSSNSNDADSRHKDIREMQVKDTIAKKKDRLSIVEHEVIPDTTINRKLVLEDQKSIGEIYTKRIIKGTIERLRQTPAVIFRDRLNKEYLLAYQYEGSIENAFSCFEIGYLENDNKVRNKKFYQTNEDNFKTESGLRLGMTLKDVLGTKGKKYKLVEKEDFSILTYSITDYTESPFLIKYNMSGYFIKIWLKDDKVQRIVLGFEYP